MRDFNDLEIEAFRGCPQSQYNLARKYDNKNEKVNIDIALFWYTQAAKQGHDESQSRLGEIYFNDYYGKGDLKKAIYWLKKAAAKFNSDAFALLGEAYEDGIGVEESYSKSYYCYKQAADMGHPVAEERARNRYRDLLFWKEEDYDDDDCGKRERKYRQKMGLE